MNELQKELFKLQDKKFKLFTAKLNPDVDKEKIIGIRVPVLRDFAKTFSNFYDTSEFLSSLPHEYHEENNLHAFLIEKIKDYDSAIREVNRFLPYIDSWDTCDMMSPKIFKKNSEKLISEIYKWTASKDVYAVRFGILCLMKYYLDENFSVKYLEHVASIKSCEYYINMMCAWYFATALAKQYDSSVIFFEKKILNEFVHNKAIQKAVESYRVTSEHKEYLKNLKIKSKK